MRRILSWSLAVALFASFACAADEIKPTAPPEPQGMISIFNGKDLTGWDGDMRLWTVKDGVIRGETTPEKQAKGNTFLIWAGGDVKDFELRLSFRIDRGNAGVQYRSKRVSKAQNNWVVGGYQAEVENTPGKAGFLYHERGPGRGYRGADNYLCRVGDKVVIDEKGVASSVGSLGDQKAIAATYRKSDWNDYVIIAKGNHIQHYINGVQTVDVIDNDPKNRLMSGVIALQIHAGPPMWVEYKDIRLKQYETSDRE